MTITDDALHASGGARHCTALHGSSGRKRAEFLELSAAGPIYDAVIGQTDPTRLEGVRTVRSLLKTHVGLGALVGFFWSGSLASVHFQQLYPRSRRNLLMFAM